ncbi:hypothetical protein CK203_022262 [Vitis vinifera]|uniref:EF-hand domain-containing protein n=1 Tax=Vitis vinifera TaxID=29760 RepID=A0A438I977_VITVI|nr:hypothetical protein CK203_022262 [Vitis vinifera]
MASGSAKNKAVGGGGGAGQVLDGSDIMELVENEEVFSSFVDHKFQELDRDCDGKLSVKELEPAVADIGAALGLPAQGTSADSDHIYSEVFGGCLRNRWKKRGSVFERQGICMRRHGGKGRQRINMRGNEFVPHLRWGWVCLFPEKWWGKERNVRDPFPTSLREDTVLSDIAFVDCLAVCKEVLNEFTHGKQEQVSKTEFKEVLSDILLGMAAGLKRDPIVILRIDGEDLREFINSPSFEPEMISIFSQFDLPEGSLRDYITKALQQLTVEQGMPPSTDSWVMSNIVEPALQTVAGCAHEQPISQDTFLAEFKKVAESVAQHLAEQPVIVAHSENTFDGSGIKRLLANKFELDKSLEAALKTVPKDRNGKMSKEYLRVALDVVGPSAGLPPYGGLEEMDKVVTDVFNMVNADDGKVVKEDEFKKLLTEILGSIMLQLEGSPISVSSNSVVHEPLTSSTLLSPSS